MCNTIYEEYSYFRHNNRTQQSFVSHFLQPDAQKYSCCINDSTLCNYLRIYFVQRISTAHLPLSQQDDVLKTNQQINSYENSKILISSLLIHSELPFNKSIRNNDTIYGMANTTRQYVSRNKNLSRFKHNQQIVRTRSSRPPIRLRLSPTINFQFRTCACAYTIRTKNSCKKLYTSPGSIMHWESKQ